MQRNIEEINLKKENDNAKKEQAAVILLKYIRRHHARKKFHIQHLSKEEAATNETFVVGNDPNLPSLQEYREKDEQIAILATSGLRVLEIAGELGNPKKTPKVILIDYSYKVYLFWTALRDFMRNDEQSANEQIFFKNIDDFLLEHHNLYKHLNEELITSRKNGVAYPNQNIKKYFQKLFSNHSYAFARAIILNTSFILQSWSHPETFTKIKNILNFLEIKKVYAYPSNIFPVLSLKKKNHEAQTLLDNIEKISPIFSLHTNTCRLHRLPEKSLLFFKNDSKAVSDKLLDFSCINQKNIMNVSYLLFSVTVIIALLMAYRNLFDYSSPKPF